MASIPISNPQLESAVKSAAAELVSVRHIRGASFVSLPLIGPDGSSVTVRVVADMFGFRVDDAGATHRDLKRLGLHRSFHKTATAVIGEDDVSIEDEAIVSYAKAADLALAIGDVGCVAWETTRRIYARLDDAGEEEMAESLRLRLAAIFGSSLDDKQQINGLSTTLWKVSAILEVDGHLAVFQAVTDNANSVYRASAAFHDLASLPKPPSLVAVVKNKAALGPKLAILSQTDARIIEEGQSDDHYKRAAA